MSPADCPQGWVLMPQHLVTPAITARAVALLHEWRASGMPVGATDSVEWTGAFLCDYRFEMHPPDFNNPVPHTGVTVFYCPKAVKAPPAPPEPPPEPVPTGSPSGCPPPPSCS